MKLFTLSLLFFTTWCTFAWPTSREESDDCTELPRSLREGLFVLHTLTFPTNQPNGFQEEHRHFGQRMTPLEMICFAFDTAWDVELGKGRFYNGSATRSSAHVVDTVSRQICSWIKSLRHDTLPECGPSEVSMYCWQVRTSNTAHRAGQSLGSISDIDTQEWITSNLSGADENVVNFIHSARP